MTHFANAMNLEQEQQTGKKTPPMDGVTSEALV
jgi:hypothetical protein